MTRMKVSGLAAASLGVILLRVGRNPSIVGDLILKSPRRRRCAWRRSQEFGYT